MKKQAEQLRHSTVGELLKEYFLDEMEITQYRLAEECKLPRNCIAGIVKGTRRITTDIAIRLAAFYGNSPEFWINGQVRDDIRKAQSNGTFEQIMSEIKPLKQAS